MLLPIKIPMSSRAKVGTACCAAAIGLTAVSLFSGIPAFATVASSFTVNTESEGSFAAIDVKASKSGTWDLFLKTKDKSTVGVDQITINTGRASGWHTHAGAVLVTVTAGQVDVIDGGDCSVKTYQAGEGFAEKGGGHVHNVTNPYGLTAHLVGIQIRPLGSPGGLPPPTVPNCP